MSYSRRLFAVFVFATVSILIVSPATADPSPAVVVSPKHASALEAFAAREVQRYIYVRTGTLLPFANKPGKRDAIILAQKSDPLLDSIRAEGQLDVLEEQDYLLRTVRDENGRSTIYLVGGCETAVLYAAYRFAEHLGVRFYLHGDVIPDESILFVLPDLDEMASPLFPLRGIQPFHDFPEGPDWWNMNNYKAIIGQLPKLRMNFLGLHTYPENRPNAEPTVWIGRTDDVEPDGGVSFSYPASYYNTAMNVGWGLQAKKTSDYYCGAGALFDRDDFGSEVMHGLTPMPDAPEACNEVFERAGVMLRDAFKHASVLGVKTCVGTETPLVVPKRVQERISPGNTVPGNAGHQPGSSSAEDLYAGMFTRIMKAYPIDYYWFWTPETWTWEGTTQEDTQKTIDDILAAKAAAERVGAPFQLATCGWVLGPQFDRAYLDKALPKDFAVSCISRAVGHDPVEPAFAQISGRDKWAIPWLEDDPAMTSPQLWVARMRRDARDALDYGCTGLMGIHWRTRILGPNVAALAQAAWDQSGWTEPERKTGPVGGRVAQFSQTDFADTADDALYQSVRYDMSAYAIEVPNGRYTVTLHLCEPYYREPGKRIFGYRVENTAPVEHLDILASIGPDRAMVKTVENVTVEDGTLDINFIKEMEFPCVAAIEVVGETFAQRINCGGPAIGDFIADPEPVIAGPLPDDFYSDWAASEFGSEVGGDAARILSALDGKLPVPSAWIGGPGGYTPDEKPWDEVKKEYAFVDDLAALRDRITTPGNLARFDYWLSTFEYLRASAKVRCAWGAFNAAMKSVEEKAIAKVDTPRDDTRAAAEHPPRHFVSAPFKGGPNGASFAAHHTQPDTWFLPVRSSPEPATRVEQGPPLKGAGPQGRGGCSSPSALLAQLAFAASAPNNTKAQLARDVALPRWLELIDAVREMYGYLLATVNTTGEMGTVCNWEQHTFPALLDETAAKLSAALGEPISPDNYLSRTYEGEPRIIVPAVRTAVSKGEDLVIPIIILDDQPPREVTIHYRPLRAKKYTTKSAEHVGRNTYQARIPAEEFPQTGVEYHVEASTQEGEMIQWPASGGTINQSVILSL
ncbi:MAG: hypothetical protein IT364_13400 [Candidatus Hydrogenedentes bacterium]|nr:hypothetical protein [Candidatus Hydrogenedentota bacterium]